MCSQFLKIEQTHHTLQGNKFVVSIKDYITRESTLLSFRRGDVIKLLDAEMQLEDGTILHREDAINTMHSLLAYISLAVKKC